ncbi:MAG: tetratricopeptide repeat protein [Myxococcota bacterium]
MLQLTTLLPAPPGGRPTSREALWERLVRPFLDAQGFQDLSLTRIEQKSTSRLGWLLYHRQARPELPPDLLIVPELQQLSPGTLLEEVQQWALELEQSPPLIALCYPQRSGYVLSVFETHTGNPVGTAFPSPAELGLMADGLRRSQRAAVPLPSHLLLTQQLHTAQLTHDSTLELEALMGLSELYLRQGQYPEAEQTLSQLAQRSEIHHNPRLHAHVLRDLGQVQLQLEKLAEAEQWLIEAAELYRRQGDRLGWGGTLHDLAAVLRQQDRVESALLLLQEALRLAQHEELLSLEAAALHNLALLQAEVGLLPEACAQLERSLELTTLLGQAAEEIIVRHNLAVLYLRQGRDEAALRLLKEVRSLSQKAPTPP